MNLIWVAEVQKFAKGLAGRFPIQPNQTANERSQALLMAEDLLEALPPPHLFRGEQKPLQLFQVLLGELPVHAQLVDGDMVAVIADEAFHLAGTDVFPQRWHSPARRSPTVQVQKFSLQDGESAEGEGCSRIAVSS
ncbi:hypothetical protein [Oryzomonas rubra]|uniref:Uncharacterized protein n=1 Tax=Oryzomonas rubra TaxID=2509454 RepID=A0A5A9X827_9BACT|nr:hypothetical protein [Oryzomonas rubra]KAA0888369.1 hypothetical protein ET418_16695 [Oryzomonas rubra]